MAEPIHVTWADVAQSFHVGDACQHAPVPPLDTLVNPPEEPVVPLGRDPNLRVPGARPLTSPPLDADGVPLEVPPGGLPRDPETGAPIWPDAEGNPILPGEEPVPEPAPKAMPAEDEPTETTLPPPSTPSTSSSSS